MRVRVPVACGWVLAGVLGHAATARSARADPGPEILLRGSWAHAGAGSPVDVDPVAGTLEANEPVVAGNEPYRPGPMAELALGYRFAALPISIGLTGRYRWSGTREQTREDDGRWGYGLGPYARVYLPLGPVELWGSIGAEWTIDTQRWYREGLERRLVHEGIAFPIGLGVDVRLARHFAIGASGQIAPVIGVRDCWQLGAGSPATTSPATPSCGGIAGVDTDAGAYTIVSGGLHVRVPWE